MIFLYQKATKLDKFLNKKHRILPFFRRFIRQYFSTIFSTFFFFGRGFFWGERSFFDSIFFFFFFWQFFQFHALDSTAEVGLVLLLGKLARQPKVNHVAMGKWSKNEGKWSKNDAKMTQK
jgi:hypothetical protein